MNKKIAKRVKYADDNTIGCGGSYKGALDISYAELVELFGEPNTSGDAYKVDAQWSLDFDGHYISIYNYKDGKNYLGSDGLDIEDIRDWHIGGQDKEKANEFIKLVEKTISQK